MLHLSSHHASNITERGLQGSTGGPTGGDEHDGWSAGGAGHVGRAAFGGILRREVHSSSKDELCGKLSTVPLPPWALNVVPGANAGGQEWNYLKAVSLQDVVSIQDVESFAVKAAPL